MRNFLKTMWYVLCTLGAMAAGVVGRPMKNGAILMYHSVEKSKWKYSVTPQNFERQVSYLAGNFTIVSLADMIAYAEKKKDLPKRSVAITLDDGYADTYTTVFPVIKKYNVPITVFLTSDLQESPKLGNLSRISWAQVEEMSKSGLVSFGVHGHTHANLAKLSDDKDALSHEIVLCADIIEEHTHVRPTTIAYAAGHKNSTVIEFLRQHGFTAGLTINEGFIRQGDDLFRLKRIQVDGTMNFVLFKMRLTRALEFNRWIVDTLRKFYGRQT